MPPSGPFFYPSFLPRLLVAFLLTGLPLLAESALAGTPRPEDFIKDDSRLLTEESRAKVRGAIEEAARSGLQVGFAATTVLPHPAIAGELKDAWFPDDSHAAMIVYSRDMDRFFVADARDKDPKYNSFAANQAIRQANSALANLNRDRDGRDPMVVGHAATLIVALGETARTARHKTGFQNAAKMLGLWTGAAALLCLPIFFLLRSGRKKPGARTHALPFPDVNVPPRLGATNGGIMGAEIHVGSPRSGGKKET